MDRYAVHPNLSDQPYWQPYLVLYTEEDLEKEGIQYAEYAIVVGFKVPESGPIPRNYRAQLAELMVLTRALEWSQRNRVNIYTDSKDAFLVLHAHDTLWKQRWLPRTSGT